MRIQSISIKYIKWDLTEFAHGERLKIEARLPEALTSFILHLPPHIDTIYSAEGKRRVLDALSLRYRIKAIDVLYVVNDHATSGEVSPVAPTTRLIKLNCEHCIDYDPEYIMVNVTNCTVQIKVDRIYCDQYGDPIGERPIGPLPDVRFDDITFSKDSQFSYYCPGCGEEQSLTDWLLSGQLHLTKPQ